MLRTGWWRTMVSVATLSCPPPARAAGRRSSLRALQSVWERRSRSADRAVQAWRESCTALLSALIRGNPDEVSRREAACVQRQRDVDTATAREVAARDRFLARVVSPAGARHVS